MNKITKPKGFRISPLLIAMLLVVFTIGMANADDGLQISKLPDYGPEQFQALLDKPNVTDIRGTMPELVLEENKKKWLDKISRSGLETSSAVELKPYMEQNGGPIIMTGYSSDGCLLVSFNAKAKGTFDEIKYINNIYEIYNNKSTKLGVKDIPVVFEYESIPVEDSRTSNWRPLIGGIKIRHSFSSSTLGFAGEKVHNGDKGYIMTGHAGGIGTNIYQPTFSSVGSITDLGGTYADAAWVKYSNVEAKVYHTDTDVTKSVKSYDDPSVNDDIYMSGKTTGLSSGDAVAYLYSISSPPHGTLYGQWRADYDSDSGDSGAPVYKTVTGGVEIVGIHWGHSASYTYFSPVSGIEDDLGVVPLTE